jgi:hypothetical protein
MPACSPLPRTWVHNKQFRLICYLVCNPRAGVNIIHTECFTWGGEMRKVLFPCFLAILCCAKIVAQTNSPTPNLISPPPPIEGTASLAPSSELHYKYYFDHNALSDGVEVGGSVFAITDSGNLIRFDAKTLEMTGRAVVPGMAKAISADEGGVLVGTRSGDILAVDGATLAQKEVAELHGEIIWLARKRGTARTTSGIVAVVAPYAANVVWPGETDNHLQTRLKSIDAGRFEAALFEGGKQREYRIAEDKKQVTHPDTFLLDAQGKLWMGTNGGEFGGGVLRLDLNTGTVRKVDAGSDVLGFLQTPDGATFAYGGVSHMGGNSGFIARADNEKLTALRNFEHNDWQTAEQDKERSPDNMPQGPVDRVLEDREGGGFWVLSGQGLFHCDRGFASWTKTLDIGGRWIGGRALSAMADTPTVNSLLMSGSESGEMIAVMGRDGLARISTDGIERHEFAGQLESTIVDIWGTSIGTLFLSDSSFELTDWRRSGDSWSSLTLVPSRPPADSDERWDFGIPIADDSTGLIAFAGSGAFPGEHDLIRVKADGQTEVLDMWKDMSTKFDTEFLPSDDGKLIDYYGDASDSGTDSLRLRDGGVWSSIGHGNIPDGAETLRGEAGRRTLYLGRNKDAQYFADMALGDIFQLTEGPSGKFQLTTAKYGVRQAPRYIFDVSPDRDGWFLLAAAEDGLMEFRAVDGRSRLIPSPPPGDTIVALCRDGGGRLWAAGQRLYLSSNEGKMWDRIDLPMMSGTFATRVRPDPQNARGVILAVQDRGVVFLSW